MTQRSSLAWNAAILCSAVLWGTLWIPLRALRGTGLSGASAITAGFLLPLIALCPFAWGRWRHILSGGRALGMASFFLAVSIAFYAEGVVRGQVARVLLLFYLTPVWSTLLARWLLGEEITGRRITTIFLGLAGMLVIFGGDASVHTSGAVGEWMGLAGGVTWGVSMVYLHRTASRPLFDRVVAQFVFLGPVFFLVTLVPGGLPGARSGAEALLDAGPWLLALAVAWMLPVIGLTILGASRLDPGRVAILLMLEILVGLTTAIVLTEEPFGLREVVGGGLILAAGGAELVPRR